MIIPNSSKYCLLFIWHQDSTLRVTVLTVLLSSKILVLYDLKFSELSKQNSRLFDVTSGNTYEWKLKVKEIKGEQGCAYS